jgi:hypothetical protein
MPMSPRLMTRLSEPKPTTRPATRTQLPKLATPTKPKSSMTAAKQKPKPNPLPPRLPKRGRKRTPAARGPSPYQRPGQASLEAALARPSALRGVECLTNVGDQVDRVLDAYRQSHQTSGDLQAGPGDRAVSHGGWHFDE